jgi:hypothetical protein
MDKSANEAKTLDAIHFIWLDERRANSGGNVWVIIYDPKTGRAWQLPSDWPMEDIERVHSKVALAHQLAEDRGQVLFELEVNRPLGATYMPSSRGLYLARIRLPNWPHGVQINSLAHLAHVEGLPVAWVPDAEMIAQWLRAPDHEARIDLLEVRAESVEMHCLEVVRSIVSPEFNFFRNCLEEAIVALRNGSSLASQALSTAVVTTLIEEHLGLSLSAARRKEGDLLIQLAEVPSTGISVGTAVAQLAYLPALAQNLRSEDPVTRYNRHTSIHRVSVQQYTLANALIALMHAVAVLRQLEFNKQAAAHRKEE